MLGTIAQRFKLPPLVGFLESVLRACGPDVPAAARPYRQLDGALTALGSMVDVLKKSPPYNAQLEAVLMALGSRGMARF